jgi:ABC-type sugar transport system substrate-binding protein
MITVGSVEMLNGQLRRQGVIDNLLDRPFKPDRTADALDANLKGKKYSIVATVVDENDAAKAPALLAAAIKAHPGVKCIVGLFGHCAPAALKAIEQTGNSGRIMVVGFDDLDETQAGIEAGTVYSSILQDQYGLGYETVRILADTVRGAEQVTNQKKQRLSPLAISVLRRDNLAYMRAQGRIRQPNSNPPASD